MTPLLSSFPSKETGCPLGVGCAVGEAPLGPRQLPRSRPRERTVSIAEDRRPCLVAAQLINRPMSSPLYLRACPPTYCSTEASFRALLCSPQRKGFQIPEHQALGVALLPSCPSPIYMTTPGSQSWTRGCEGHGEGEPTVWKGRPPNTAPDSLEPHSLSSSRPCSDSE